LRSDAVCAGLINVRSWNFADIALMPHFGVKRTFSWERELMFAFRGSEDIRIARAVSAFREQADIIRLRPNLR